MNYFNNIYKLGIQTFDYGEEFSFAERYEYTILTFDKEENKDTIPGTYNNKEDILKRIRELKREIKNKIRREIKIDDKIYLLSIKDSNDNKNKKLEDKRTALETKIIKKANERWRQAQVGRNYPGGSHDHSQR